MNDIRMMKPGREMDVLVAKQVMGWTHRDDDPDGLSCPEFDSPGWLHSPQWKDGEWQCAKCFDLPHWSTDGGKALHVVDEMQAKGFYVTMSHHPEPGQPWRVELESVKQSEPTPSAELFFALGDTLPEAVCKAALLVEL